MTAKKAQMQKDAPAEGHIRLMIWKGDIQVMGAADKIAAIKTVSRFVQRTCPDVKLFEGANMLAIDMPDIEGEATWLAENVFRRVYLVGMTGDKAIDATVDKAVRIYDEVRDGQDRSGYGIILHYLNRQYMKYDLWRP